jgi:hypothetical protein
MIRSDPTHYGIIFLVLFVFATPVVLALMPVMMAGVGAPAAGWQGPVAGVLFMAADIGLFLLARQYNGSVELSLRQGLGTISAAMSSGCANLTILYIFPLLGVVYTVAVANALLGLFQGQERAQKRWLRLVGWFARHSLR